MRGKMFAMGVPGNQESCLPEFITICGIASSVDSDKQ